MTSKRFLPLFIVQIFYTLNDNIFKNALLIWFTFNFAKKTGENADLMTSITIGLYILPLFLFSAMAGQLADKFDKAKIVRILMLIEILLMIGCTAFFYYEKANLLISVFILTGFLFTFLVPVKYSLLPDHLHPHELLKGNGLIEGGTFIATVVGTIVGGTLIDSYNGKGVLIVGGILIVSATLAYISSLSIPSAPRKDKEPISWNIFSVAKNALQFAIADKQILMIILAISWIWFIILTFLSHFPPYTSDIIHGSEYLVTFLLTIFSIGIAIGAMICNQLLKGMISTRFLPASTLVISLGIFLFCLFSYLFHLNYHMSAPFGIISFLKLGYYSIAIIVSLLMISIACGLYIIPLYSAMQRLSDQRYVARIIAANNILNALFMGLSSLFAWILVKLNFSIIGIILIVGIINLLVVVYLKRSKLLTISIDH